jgi:hypothetical protein
MTLTIVAGIFFAAHVVAWIRLPASSAEDSMVMPSDTALETSMG